MFKKAKICRKELFAVGLKRCCLFLQFPLDFSLPSFVSGRVLPLMKGKPQENLNLWKDFTVQQTSTDEDRWENTGRCLPE